MVATINANNKISVTYQMKMSDQQSKIYTFLESSNSLVKRRFGISTNNIENKTINEDS